MNTNISKLKYMYKLLVNSLWAADIFVDIKEHVHIDPLGEKPSHPFLEIEFNGGENIGGNAFVEIAGLSNFEILKLIIKTIETEYGDIKASEVNFLVTLENLDDTLNELIRTTNVLCEEDKIYYKKVLQKGYDLKTALDEVEI